MEQGVGQVGVVIYRRLSSKGDQKIKFYDIRPPIHGGCPMVGSVDPSSTIPRSTGIWNIEQLLAEAHGSCQTMKRH